MKGLFVKRSALAALMLLAVSCSIREERDGCPCLLTLDLSGCGMFGDLLIEGWEDGAEIFSGKLSSADYPEGYTVRTGRNGIWYLAHAPLEKAGKSGYLITVPEGEQSDSLFLCFRRVDTSEEAAYDRVLLHKNHMELGIRINGWDSLKCGLLELEVRAQYNALDTRDMTPVKGEFSYRTEVAGEMSRIRLPRQKDGVISVTLSEDGRPVAGFDAWKVLKTAGYSWNDNDLADATLQIDMASSSISVCIDEWSEGNSYDEII